MISELQRKIENSALWAAAGDALGFMTELASIEKVRIRSGRGFVDETVSWSKSVVPRFKSGNIKMPAGAYSDDTQLRLSVGRCIQASGRFDIDAFAKIELPVWLSYSLGAGRASKLAATNLVKRDVSWWNNFFSAKGVSYVNAGGNGGAMRIQPHVWTTAHSENTMEMLRDVVRDTLVTHGHPIGIYGAIFHALALRDCLQNERIPGPDDWPKYLTSLTRVEEIIDKDPQLGDLWQQQWAQAAGHTFQEESHRSLAATVELVKTAVRFCNAGSDHISDLYKAVGAFDPNTRGSATITAVLACVAAWRGRFDAPSRTLIELANLLGSDTDSIATMAGAVLGCTANEAPEWDIQDKAYIAGDARRSAQIAQRLPALNFGYPVLGNFVPPTSQSDAVGLINGEIGLIALGEGTVVGDPVRFDRYQWQWIELWFGQTVLAKRRIGSLEPIDPSRIPAGMRKGLERRRDITTDRVRVSRDRLEPNENERRGGETPLPPRTPNALQRRTIDDIYAEAKRAGLSEAAVGAAILECIRTHGTVEAATALVALIARASIANLKRQSRLT